MRRKTVAPAATLHLVMLMTIMGLCLALYVSIRAMGVLVAREEAARADESWRERALAAEATVRMLEARRGSTETTSVAAGPL